MYIFKRLKGSTASNVLIAAIVLIVILGIGYYMAKNNSSNYATPTPTQTSSNSTVTGTQTVNIADMAFSPSTLTISVGDTVTWTNNDSVAHTVVSTDNGPLNSGNLNKSASYSYTFTQAGTYTYKCSYHPSMTGTITVQ